MRPTYIQIKFVLFFFFLLLMSCINLIIRPAKRTKMGSGKFSRPRHYKKKKKTRLVSDILLISEYLNKNFADGFNKMANISLFLILIKHKHSYCLKILKVSTFYHLNILCKWKNMKGN